MLELNGKRIRIHFETGIGLSEFYWDGKPESRQVEAMGCSLLDEQGKLLISSFVRRNHKDPQNEKIARKAAFKKAVKELVAEHQVSQPEASQLLQQFFKKRKRPAKRMAQ